MTKELKLAKQIKEAAEFFKYYACLNEAEQDRSANELSEKLEWIGKLAEEVLNLRKEIKIEMAKEKVAPWLARVVRKDV